MCSCLFVVDDFNLQLIAYSHKQFNFSFSFRFRYALIIAAVPEAETGARRTEDRAGKGRSEARADGALEKVENREREKNIVKQ